LKINGEKLRIALRTAGISQEKASQALGISRPTLVLRLRSDELDYDFVLKVKRVLKIDLEIDNVINNLQSVEDNIHTDLAGSQIIGHNANKTGNDGYNIPGNKNVTIQKEIDTEDILSLQEFILAEQRETNRLLKKQIELLNKIIPKG
jgi:transcriptional regulator with XRE-family HTH domain